MAQLHPEQGANELYLGNSNPAETYKWVMNFLGFSKPSGGYRYYARTSKICARFVAFALNARVIRHKQSKFWKEHFEVRKFVGKSK